MQTFGKVLRALLLLVGLGLVALGLFCGALGLTDEPLRADGVLRISEVFVAISALALGLGGGLIFFVMRGFNRRKEVADAPTKSTPDDQP